MLTAHAIVQRSLPRGRDKDVRPALPAPRRSPWTPRDPGYALLRDRVVRQALDADLPLLRFALPKRVATAARSLPRVWGLRLAPRQGGGAGELALEHRLASMPGPVRAAFVLRGLERLPEAEVRRVLDAAGIADPATTVASAARAAGDGPGGGGTGCVDPSLLRSPSSTPARSRRGPRI